MRTIRHPVIFVGQVRDPNEDYTSSGTNEEVAAALEEDDKLKAELLSRPVIHEVIKETNQEMKG